MLPITQLDLTKYNNISALFQKLREEEITEIEVEVGFFNFIKITLAEVVSSREEKIDIQQGGIEYSFSVEDLRIATNRALAQKAYRAWYTEDKIKCGTFTISGKKYNEKQLDLLKKQMDQMQVKDVIEFLAEQRNRIEYLQIPMSSGLLGLVRERCKQNFVVKLTPDEKAQLMQQMLAFAVTGFRFDKENGKIYQELIQYAIDNYYNIKNYSKENKTLSEIEQKFQKAFSEMISSKVKDDDDKLLQKLNEFKNCGLDPLWADLSVGMGLEKFDDFSDKVKILPVLFQIPHVSISYSQDKHAVLNHFIKIKEKCANGSKDHAYLGKSMLALLLMIQNKRINGPGILQLNGDKKEIIKVIVAGQQKDSLKTAIEDYINNIAQQNPDVTLADKINIKELQIDFLKKQILNEKSWVYAVLSDRKFFGKSKNLEAVETLYNDLTKKLNELKQILAKERFDDMESDSDSELEFLNSDKQEIEAQIPNWHEAFNNDDDIKDKQKLLAEIKSNSQFDDPKLLEEKLAQLKENYHMTWKELGDELNDKAGPTILNIRTLPIIHQQGLFFAYGKSNRQIGMVLQHFKNINKFSLPNASKDKNVELETKKIKGTAMLVLLLQLNLYPKNMDENSWSEAIRDKHKIVDIIRTEENKEALLIALKQWVNDIQLSQEEKENTDDAEIALLKKKVEFMNGLLKERSWTHAAITNFGHSAGGDTTKQVKKLKSDLENELQKRQPSSSKKLEPFSQFISPNYLKELASAYDVKQLSLPTVSAQDVKCLPLFAGYNSAMINISDQFLQPGPVSGTLHVGTSGPSTDGICWLQKDNVVGLIESTSKIGGDLSIESKQNNNTLSVSYLMLIWFFQQQILRNRLIELERPVGKLELPVPISLLQKNDYYNEDMSIKILNSIQSTDELLKKLGRPSPLIAVKQNEKVSEEEIKKKIVSEDMTDFSSRLKDEYKEINNAIIDYFEMVNALTFKEKVCSVQDKQTRKAKALLDMLLHLKTLEDKDPTNRQHKKIKERIVKIIRSTQENKDLLKLAIKERVEKIAKDKPNATMEDQITLLNAQMDFLKKQILEENSWVHAALSNNGTNRTGTTFKPIEDYYNELDEKRKVLEPKEIGGARLEKQRKANIWSSFFAEKKEESLFGLDQRRNIPGFGDL